ncbi:MAG: hypothetical protein ACYCTB_05695 [bacterium]
MGENQAKNDFAQKNVERNVERAKDPFARVIKPKSMELAMSVGRIQLADGIITILRRKVGIQYDFKMVEEAIKALLAAFKGIDEFNAKYAHVVFPDDKKRYKLLSFIGAKVNEDAFNEQSDVKEKHKKKEAE